ncbi:Abi family protein [Corynebacterium sp. c7Ub_26]
MRNQGSFYISCIGDLVPVPPHLPNDTQRREYLRNKGYFDETLLSDELVAQLSHLNFHYFLGYARNYAMLHNLGIFKGNRDPQHVFDLISLDQKVATLLFAWIRRAELGLRNRTVDFFCENSSPTRYLDEKCLRRLSKEEDERQFVGGMLREIFRYGEDYVKDAITKRADELGCKNLVDTGKIPTTYVCRSPKTCHFGRSLIVFRWGSLASSS